MGDPHRRLRSIHHRPNKHHRDQRTKFGKCLFPFVLSVVSSAEQGDCFRVLVYTHISIHRLRSLDSRSTLSSLQRPSVAAHRALLLLLSPPDGRLRRIHRNHISSLSTLSSNLVPFPFLYSCPSPLPISSHHPTSPLPKRSNSTTSDPPTPAYLPN